MPSLIRSIYGIELLFAIVGNDTQNFSVAINWLVAAIRVGISSIWLEMPPPEDCPPAQPTIEGPPRKAAADSITRRVVHAHFDVKWRLSAQEDGAVYGPAWHGQLYTTNRFRHKRVYRLTLCFRAGNEELYIIQLSRVAFVIVACRTSWEERQLVNDNLEYLMPTDLGSRYQLWLLPTRYTNQDRLWLLIP